MRIRLIFALAALVVFTCTCSDTPSSSSNAGPDKQSLPMPPSSSNTVASDSGQGNANAGNVSASAAPMQGNFLMEAAQDGMAEVELGRLASEKAQDAEVKRFAAMMVADHGQSNTELLSVASKKGVTPPTTPGPMHQSKMTELRGLSGAEFDRAYADAMVAAHEKSVSMFSEQSTANPDAEVKAFAAKTLPTLQKHLDEIKGIRSKLK